MKTALLCLLLTALALPAYAGHGTIEETDDGFIVEYTGDAADKPVDKAADKSAERNLAKRMEPSISATTPPQQASAEEERAARTRERERREESRRRMRGTRGQPAADGSPDEE